MTKPSRAEIAREAAPQMARILAKYADRTHALRSTSGQGGTPAANLDEQAAS